MGVARHRQSKKKFLDIFKFVELQNYVIDQF